MAATDPGAKLALRTSRTFASPREKVFRAWIDPEAIKLVLTHERFPSATSREEHAQGWESCLDAIGRLASSY